MNDLQDASNNLSTKSVEEILAEEQHKVLNLTTFVVYPFPSRLVEVP